MRTLAIIVTYYPNKGLLLKEVESIYSDVEKLLIWENTPSNESGKYRFFEGEKVEYIEGRRNSISDALNYAWRYASENGYDAILTMDQDSCFEDFKYYVSLAKEQIMKENCIVGPWYYDKVPFDSFSPIVERDYIITSGMLVPVSLISSIGGYCSSFSVDGIDTEFCLRAKNKGFKVLQLKNCWMDQHFGNQYRICKHGREFVGSGYGPFRLEGFFRNYVITYRVYRNPSVKHDINRVLVQTVKNVIAVENRKVAKLWAISKGLISGMFYPLSRLSYGEN